MENGVPPQPNPYAHLASYHHPNGRKEAPAPSGGAVRPTQPVVVRTYMGAQDTATAAFRTDAAMLGDYGYVPVSQTWVPGAYGCGAFILALLLCVVLVGFIVFIYMLIVKPTGTLTVTYELRTPLSADDEKTCPRCAERVKAAAEVCRFCGHEF